MNNDELDSLSLEASAAPAEASSSSLEPLETNSNAQSRWSKRDLYEPLAATAAQHRLHARHWKERERLIRVLLDCPDEGLQRRALRLDGCCQVPALRLTAEGQGVLVLNTCRDRLCPRCQRHRGVELRSRIQALIGAMKEPRFITLTLKHKPETLRQNHDRLMQGLKRLRRERVWKANVEGGLYVVEVTRNRGTGRWHTHLHVVVDGSFLPQKLLSSAWKNSTGDSVIVDVRAVKNSKAVAGYLATYVAKPTEFHTWQADEIVEFASHMHGRRMVATFGSLHKANVDPEPAAEAKGATTFVANVHEISKHARNGYEPARKAREILCNYSAAWAMALGEEPRQRHEDCEPPPEPDWYEIANAARGPVLALPPMPTPVIRTPDRLFHSDRYD